MLLDEIEADVLAGFGAKRLLFFLSSRRRHTRLQGDWSSDVCSSDLSNTAHTPPSPSPPDPSHRARWLQQSSSSIRRDRTPASPAAQSWSPASPSQNHAPADRKSVV